MTDDSEEFKKDIKKPKKGEKIDEVFKKMVERVESKTKAIRQGTLESSKTLDNILQYQAEKEAQPFLQTEALQKITKKIENIERDITKLKKGKPLRQRIKEKWAEWIFFGVIILILSVALSFFVKSRLEYYFTKPTLSVPKEFLVNYKNKTIELYIANEAPHKAANDIIIEGKEDGEWIKIQHIIQIAGGKQEPVSIQLYEKEKETNNVFSISSTSCPTGTTVHYSGGILVGIEHPVKLENIINRTCYGTYISESLNESFPIEISHFFQDKLEVRIFCENCFPKGYHYSNAQITINAIGHGKTSSCKLKLCTSETCFDSNCRFNSTEGYTIENTLVFSKPFN